MSIILNLSYGQGSQASVDQPHDLYKTFTEIGIPLITLAGTLRGGVLSAKYIVGRWQTRKELSDIRRAILINYTNSFKNYITLMDTFVAKLVMEFAELISNKPSNKTTLSELLPWGFTFNDLDYYLHNVSKDRNLTNFKNKSYEDQVIKEKFHY